MSYVLYEITPQRKSYAWHMKVAIESWLAAKWRLITQILDCPLYCCWLYFSIVVFKKRVHLTVFFCEHFFPIYNFLHHKRTRLDTVRVTLLRGIKLGLSFRCVDEERGCLPYEFKLFSASKHTINKI